MNHDELKDRIKDLKIASHESALLAIVELHKPKEIDYYEKFLVCEECSIFEDDESFILRYPCPTIQAIEKELS